MPVEKNPTANRNSVGGLTASAFVAGRENDGLKSSAKRSSLEKKDALPEPGGPWSSQEFTCSLCKQMFSSRERLRAHEYHHTVPQMSHDWAGVKGLHYQAPLPELQFHQSLYRSTVAMSVPGRYSCSHCPARFTLKSNASRHEKTIHLKKKLLKCIHCLKHFRDRTDLHRHVSSMHSKVRHTCPACAKDFSTTQNLATHFEMLWIHVKALFSQLKPLQIFLQ
uniref:C2H2-type domain-containing protein n=1 Tax=Cynoglossus semilaevis TaxID=244447 RepID=A0A3P8WQ20_CYNSE